MRDFGAIVCSPPLFMVGGQTELAASEQDRRAATVLVTTPAAVLVAFRVTGRLGRASGGPAPEAVVVPADVPLSAKRRPR